MLPLHHSPMELRSKINALADFTAISGAPGGKSLRSGMAPLYPLGSAVASMGKTPIELSIRGSRGGHARASLRRLARPSFAIDHPLRKQTAQGRPGGRMHPGLPRKQLRKERENLRVQAVTTGLPCAMVYGL